MNKQIILLMFFLFGTIFPSSVLYVSAQDNQSSNVMSNFQENKSGSYDPTLFVSTDRVRYVPGELMVIGGTVFHSSGDPADVPVSITVEKTTDEKQTPGIVYQSSIQSTGGDFQDRGVNLQSSGHYKITAKAVVDEKNVISINEFEVVEYYNTIPFTMMCVGILSFSGLSIVIFKGSKIRPVHRELLRFVFITIIVLVPIVVFVLTEVEIGTTSPVGLILKPSGITPSTQEWVINVGGTYADGYSNGIQIPIFVFLFGLGGGYIRYLHTTYRELWVDKNSPDDDEDDEVQKKVFRHSIKDLALLFLSPLLSFAAYFLLLQAGISEPKNIYTIAAVCFGVGLSTDKIIARLEGFVAGAIETGTKKTNSEQKSS